MSARAITVGIPGQDGKDGVDATGFADVASLGASTSLTAGDVVDCREYYAGTGGGGTGEVKATGTADGYSVIALSGGLFWHRIFNGPSDIYEAGVKGDGVTDDTAAVTAFFARSGAKTVSDGTFLIDDVSISVKVSVKCSSGAVFKRRSTPSATSSTIKFVAGSDGSTWDGGIFDGDRATRKSGYSPSNFYSEFHAVGTNDLKIENLTIKNAVNTGLYINNCDRINVRGSLTDNCCVGQLILQCDDGVYTDALDTNATNDGIAIDVRGIFFNTCDSMKIDNIDCRGMGGDTAVPSPTDTVTAILGMDMTNCLISNVIVDAMTDDIDHLAQSWIGCTNCQFTTLKAFDFAGTGIEFGGCYGSVLTGFVIDSKYHETSFSSDLQTVGFIPHTSALYPLGKRTRRAVSTNQPLKVSDGLILRCAIGVQSNSQNITYNNVHSTANRLHGWRIQKEANAGSFSNAADSIPDETVLDGCSGTYNEKGGLSMRAGLNLNVRGGNYSNNDQSASGGSISYGIGYEGSDTIDRLIVGGGAVVNEDQTFTTTDGASFKPGTASALLANNNAPCYWVTLTDNRHCHMGQYIKFVNADGSGDIDARIIDIDLDEYLVAATGTVTWSDTGNKTAITGTWTTNGTDPLQIDGTGGAALTELNGPFWITDGTDWRQATSTVDDNTFTIDEAFTTALSGATVNKLSVDIQGIPSQHYGLSLSNANILELMTGEIFASGNITADNLITNAANIKGSLFSRAESHSTKSFSIANAAAISFTPAQTGGLIIVTDDTNTAGFATFRATASPLMTKGGGTSTFAVTTGALTGALGGSSLTVSSHTDGKVYIENNRGSTRDITVMVMAEE